MVFDKNERLINLVNDGYIRVQDYSDYTHTKYKKYKHFHFYISIFMYVCKKKLIFSMCVVKADLKMNESVIGWIYEAFIFLIVSNFKHETFF